MGEAVLTESVVAQEQQLPGGLYYRHWKAVGVTRAVILLVHGLGEHSGRYQGLADILCAGGFTIVAPDHIGHGHSAGRRGHLLNFEEYTAPLQMLRVKIGQDYPGLPCFLIGHSMGGLISARYLLDSQQQFVGAVLSGPALAVAEPPSALLLMINALFSKLWPSLALMQLDASLVSRDPAVVRAYIEDPLVLHGRASARLVSELFRAMEEVRKRRAEIQLPILIMHGAEDALTAVSGSEDLHINITSSDRTLRIYPGLYHEIFNEPERLDVIAELVSWLEERIPDNVQSR